jgi:uncharacterized membrane protein YfcA
MPAFVLQLWAQITTPIGALMVALTAFGGFYLVSLWNAITKAKPAETGLELGTGFVTNFFDTLGIGSFAPTTAVFKFFKIVPDRLIPGTLNVGHTLPTIAQAFIFTATIGIDPWTLIYMIAAAVAGAWLGAGVVASWPKRNIQIGLGAALLVLAGLFAWRNISEMTNTASLVTGGTDQGTLDLQGWRLIVGLAGNFMLGAFMTLGIGMYAPCMVMIGLLGMNAKAAFPIMMGSCAFLMPVSTRQFVKKDAYSLRPALALGIGGLPAVLLAGLIIKEMDLIYVRWLVIVVVLIASTMLLRSAAKGE